MVGIKRSVLQKTIKIRNKQMQNINKNNQFVIIIIGCILFFSCNNNSIYQDVVAVEKKYWSVLDTLQFKTSIIDTVGLYTCYLQLRNNNEYKYSNIFLFIKWEMPQIKGFTDTIEIQLANSKGRWHGDGFGNIFEIEIPYRSQVRFPIKGNYKWKVIHGMRVDDKGLAGIEDVGIRLEKMKQK